MIRKSPIEKLKKQLSELKKPELPKIKKPSFSRFRPGKPDLSKFRAKRPSLSSIRFERPTWRPSLPKFSFRISLPSALYYISTLLVFGAAAHISIILLMPYLSLGNAYSRLEQISNVNKMTVLASRDLRTEPLPFMAPDVRYAACRYDVSEGPLQLRTPVPNDYWSIAVYNQRGENYYLMSGRDVQSRQVIMLLVQDQTLDREKQEEQNNRAAGNKEMREVTVSALSQTGVIVVRAPVPDPAYDEEITEQLKKASCRPVSFARQASAGERETSGQ